MEPQGGIFDDQWLDQQEIGTDSKVSEKGYVHKVTYNNGVVVTEFYRYGKPGEQQTAIRTAKGINDDVQKAWLAGPGKPRSDIKYNPAPGQPGHDPNVPEGAKIVSETAVSPGAQPRVTGTAAPDPVKPAAVAPGTTSELVTGAGGNINFVTWELQPDGEKGRVISNVPASKAQIESVNGAGDKWSAAYKNQQGQWVQSQADASGQIIGTRPAPAEAIPADKDAATYTSVQQDPSTGTWFGLTKDGQWTAMQGGPGKAAEKPTVKEDPNNPGQFISIQNDPTAPGGVRVTRVAAPEGGIKPGGGPPLTELKLEYGQIVDGLTAYDAKLNEAVANQVMTPAERDKAYANALSVANTKVAELNNIVSTQKGVYGDLSANWRQEQATANTRLNAASQALQTGVASADRMTGASGAGQMANIMAIGSMGRGFGEMYGGYASGAPPQLPPALATTYEIDLPGGGKMRVAGGATPGAAPGAQSVLAQPEQVAGGGGLPPAMQSAAQAAQADAAAYKGPGLGQVPGGGYLPQGNQAGLSFSGGQVRAPGFGGPAPQTGAGGGMGGVPMSALLQTLPPDLLDSFDMNTLGEAFQDPEIMRMYGLG